MSRTSLPIGVFDSGVGGLTVFQELSRQLPDEGLTYLGDTARVPYGTRSSETVVRYSERVAGRLVSTGVKALVVACNTASTWALSILEDRGRELGIPVLGVIVPGVEQALAATRNGQVAVIGTEGTIRGGEYERQLHQRTPEVVVTSFACPLLVALAEEGWTDGDVARAVV
ncbi:MAG: glutamate racemase, partial [Myxococcota bacterium]|nr:glutamate racemase [Myxococcota bacterium]